MTSSPNPPVFDDGKEADALRTIGEVAKALGIKQHVLRYWEQQFPMLKPLKRSGGRRYYRPEDIGLIQTIDQLVNTQGYTLKGAKKALQQGDVAMPAPPAAMVAPAQTTGSDTVADIADDILPQLRAIRNKLAAVLES